MIVPDSASCNTAITLDPVLSRIKHFVVARRVATSVAELEVAVRCAYTLFEQQHLDKPLRQL
jgi:hypothetical protein